jgi:hypothetical protein
LFIDKHIVSLEHPATASPCPIPRRESADECRNGTFMGMPFQRGCPHDHSITYHLETAAKFNFLFNLKWLVKLVIRGGKLGYTGPMVRGWCSWDAQPGPTNSIFLFKMKRLLKLATRRGIRVHGQSGMRFQRGVLTTHFEPAAKCNFLFNLKRLVKLDIRGSTGPMRRGCPLPDAEPTARLSFLV